MFIASNISLMDDSPTNQLAVGEFMVWPSHGLDNSRMMRNK